MFLITIDDKQFLTEKIGFDYLTGETILYTRNGTEKDKKFLITEDTRLEIKKVK